MSTREQLETALAQARAERDKAAVDRAAAGVEWRKQEDAKVTNVTFNKVRSAWVSADAEWNRANAEVEKLTAALAAVTLSATVAQQRARLEAIIANARIERDTADAELATVARARAERENGTATTPIAVERRASSKERRKPGSDRRKHKGERRTKQAARQDGAAIAAKEWNDAVAHYNKADAEWNRARAALAEFNKLHAKK
jgi:hypothetical protein